jgi:ribosome modulation factor
MAKDFSMGWDLESLNKAYQQGYMAGVMGMTNSSCPYHGEVIKASWEAGWEDGFAACELREPVSRIA